MKNKRWFKQLFCTKMGWLGICLISALIFGTLSNWYQWAYTGITVSMIWPFVYTLISIVYAWFINPIKDFKNRKKK